VRQARLLEFPDKGDDRDIDFGSTKVTFTRFFPKDLRDDMEIQLRQVLDHFPELKGDKYKELKVGYTQAYGGNAIDGEFYIRLKANPSLNTIAHELTHHLQFAELVPSGEKSCDIYTLARDLSFCDKPPCYLDTPLMMRVEWDTWKAIAHEMAVETLRRRKVGLRTYIQWWEHMMECLYIKAVKQGWLNFEVF
jgi:hypothetical protein